MAKQLALDLGINLDTKKLTGSSMISDEEVELRRLLYWSICCDDKLAAAYTGRVCTLLVGLPNPISTSTALPSYAGLPRTCWVAIHPSPGSRHT